MIGQHVMGLIKTWDDLPLGWQLFESRMDGKAWKNEKKKLSVIASIEIHDERPWLHVSVAHPKRTPSYVELQYVRRHWIGTDVKSIMIFPAEENYVNIHKSCLHLFRCLAEEGDGLPEFSALRTIMGKVRRSI